MSINPFAAGRLSLAQQSLGLTLLADLLESGLPLTRSLLVFEQVAGDEWAPHVPKLVAGVREGRGLAQALDELHLGFPPATIGIVRAGESGSGVGRAVRRAATELEDADRRQSALRAAMAYPALVAVLGTALSIVLVTVVLPRFAETIATSGQDLPASTRWVLAAATNIERWGGLVALLVLALAAFVHNRLRSVDGRRQMDRLLLSVPLIGSIRWSRATARLTSTLGAMLESGVALRTGLKHATAAVGDDEIGARLVAARARMDAGESLASALKAEQVVSRPILQLVAAGADTGRLPSMLAFAARLEQRTSDHRIQWLTRMVEPTLILGFAGMVGIIALAMLQAIYSVKPA